MSKELVFLFPASHCDPALPLPSSVSPNLFPIFTLTFWTTSLFSSSHLQTLTFHPSCPLASIILYFYLLLISFPLLLSNHPHPTPVIKAPGSLAASKAHRAELVSLWLYSKQLSKHNQSHMCSHTHIQTLQTNFSQLKTDCYIRWSFPLPWIMSGDLHYHPPPASPFLPFPSVPHNLTLNDSL